MIRTLFLVLGILTAAVMPNPAHGSGRGGPAGTATITAPPLP
jgi:hypothetical protein